MQSSALPGEARNESVSPQRWPLLAVLDDTDAGALSIRCSPGRFGGAKPPSVSSRPPGLTVSRSQHTPRSQCWSGLRVGSRGVGRGKFPVAERRRRPSWSAVDLDLRPATMGDLAVIGDLVRHAEAYDGVPRVLVDDELAVDLAASFVDLDLDTRLAVRGGVVVGWAQVWHPEAVERLDRVHLFGEVAPEHRGTGVGRALLGWSVDRARERLEATSRRLPRYLRVEALDWLEDRHRLYRRLGFEAVR